MRSIFLLNILGLLAFGAAACGPSAPAAAVPAASPTPAATEERVTFVSEGLTLEGRVYKPAGNGPFPVLLWNHSRDTDSDEGAESDVIASAFVPAGYVIFAPVRRGEGTSQGTSLQAELDEQRSRGSEESVEALYAKLMGTDQLEDELAGLSYVRSLPYVDPNRIGVMGCADGGVLAILAAADGEGVRAALAISPASDTWTNNAPLQSMLMDAVQRLNAPVFLMHPSMDVSKSPGQLLDAEMARLNKPHQLKIFPPYGTPAEQTECFGGPSGVEVWKNDALFFFSTTMH